MKIFSGSSNLPLAEQVAKKLNLKLSEVEVHTFPDGEKRIRIKESLVDQDAVLIESTNPPVNLNYMKLFLIADTIKENGAKNLTLVCPYLGYQRQDHVFREGEGVTFKTMVKLIESVGVDKLITFDLHTIKIPEFFKIPVIHLSALPLFAAKIKKLGKNLVLVSPDLGGLRRTKELSNLLGNIPTANVVKNRDLKTGKIESQGLEGNVRGKSAVVLDDMISTGETIEAVVNLVSQNGASKIYIFATHPVFSRKASDRLSKLPVEKVYVTDSVFIPEEKYFPKLEILSIADQIAQNLQF